MDVTVTITGDLSKIAHILNTLNGQGAAAVAVEAFTPPTPVISDGAFNGVPLPVYPTSPVMPEVAAAAPTIPGEPEFDASGLAWDARIHSKQKGQTNDGKWRKQRGIDDATYNAVEAELRAKYPSVAMPASTPAPVPIAMPIPAMPENPMGNDEPVSMVSGVVAVEPVTSEPVMPVAPIAMPIPVAPVAPVAMPIPTAPVAPVAMPIPTAPAPTPAAAEPVTFYTIMQVVGTAMAAGTMTPDYLVQLIAEINQQCGTNMASFTDMAAFPNAIEYCWAAFNRDGKL